LGTGFASPAQVDGTYLGGNRKNMLNSVRKQLTRPGRVGKTRVVGAKDLATNQVTSNAVQATYKQTLRGFVTQRQEDLR